MTKPASEPETAVIHRHPDTGTVLVASGAALVVASLGAATVRLVRSEQFRPWFKAFVLGWGLVGLGGWIRHHDE